MECTKENRIKWKKLFDVSSMDELSRIDEMSASLKSYKDKVENLRFQLVENWCLCKYCQMFNSNNINYHHWIKELKIYIDGLKYVNLKNGIDKQKPLNMVLVDYYDLNDESMIFRMIRSKFKREGLLDKLEDVKSVATTMANSINGLITAIGDDEIDSDEYIVNEFKGHSGNPFFSDKAKVKDAVQRIILHEIDSIGIHYWTEVSQPIEHYFKKLDGYPIPSIFAKKLLETVGKEIELSSDDFHYSRKIDDDEIVKCMFGFQSKAVFDDIIANIGKTTPYSNYGEFRKLANSEEVHESARMENRHSIASKFPKPVCSAITIIEYLWEFYEMGRLPMLTGIQRRDLYRSIEVLKSHESGEYKNANDIRIEMANELLLMLPELTLHEI